MENVVIGIVGNINQDEPIAHYGNVAYVDAIIKAGGSPLILPVVEDSHIINDYLKLCDGFLFTGGKDINPLFYHEDLGPLCGETSMILDHYQLALFKAVRAKEKAILAVCRGMQLLNVAMGGNLYQDISLHSPYVLGHNQKSDDGDVCHMVHFKEGNILYDLYGNELAVNSYHHQAIHELAEGLKAVGSCKDGIVEAVIMEDYPFGVGVQWHPEKMMLKDDKMLGLFKAFVEAARRN